MSSVGSEQETLKIRAGEYTVTFLPARGMNFISFKKRSIEIIDQTTHYLFEERNAGLGALIGPHFHHRPGLKKEPFSHGIGRYVPWKVESSSEKEVHAVLNGSDIWNGISLKELEGQDFIMHYYATASLEGIDIHLSVQSETESVIGLHTYYALVNGEGIVKAQVAENDHIVNFAVSDACDLNFHPYPDPLKGIIELETKGYSVRVEYTCDNEENSFQLWHPAGVSFLCIEPLSAKDPRKPKLTVSQLKVRISIIE